METREETADFVRSFALSQFHKKHSFVQDSSIAETGKENLIKSIRLIKVRYVIFKVSFRPIFLI